VIFRDRGVLPNKSFEERFCFIELACFAVLDGSVKIRFLAGNCRGIDLYGDKVIFDLDFRLERPEGIVAGNLLFQKGEVFISFLPSFLPSFAAGKRVKRKSSILWMMIIDSLS